MVSLLLDGFFNSSNPYVFSLAWYFWLIMIALIAFIVGMVILIVHARNKFVELEQKQEDEIDKHDKVNKDDTDSKNDTDKDGQ